MKTFIAGSRIDGITVRGYDLSELIGSRSFSEMLYFLTVGRFPTIEQTRVLDACLVTIMEHGWTPSSLVARLTIDSVPTEIQVAMASGLLSLGSVFAGTAEGCAEILLKGVQEGGNADAYCRETVSHHRALKLTIPGFGHPLHKPDDPRTPKLLEVGAKHGANGPYVEMLHRLSREVDRTFGKHITINATGAIAALLLEIEVAPDVMRGLTVVARAGGLIGHIVEERQTHSARHIWSLAEEHIPYEDPPCEDAKLK